MALLDRADVIVAVDSVQNVAELDSAAMRYARNLRVVIEVDIGMKRAGVAPGEPVAALADAVARHAGLALVGVMAWESHAVLIPDPIEKERVVAAAIARLTGSAAACRARSHRMEIVSCGGSGTFPYCVRQPGATEIQAGGAILSGNCYGPVLNVLATVTSRPTPTRIIIDAGNRAMSTDGALPVPLGIPEIRGLRISAEHSTIELQEPSESPRFGDRLELLEQHLDFALALADRYTVLKQGAIADSGEVSAVGARRRVENQLAL